MILLISFFFIILFLSISLSRYFIQELVDSTYFLRDQLGYFTKKILGISTITYFFCFFSPTNSTKFILLSLVIFIVFHFIEAVIIQNKINMKDLNG